MFVTLRCDLNHSLSLIVRFFMQNCALLKYLFQCVHQWVNWDHISLNYVKFVLIFILSKIILFFPKNVLFWVMVASCVFFTRGGGSNHLFGVTTPSKRHIFSTLGTHTLTYTRRHTCTHTQTYTNVHVPTLTNTHTYTHTLTQTHTQIHSLTRTHSQTLTHTTITHTHTYTHKHTQTHRDTHKKDTHTHTHVLNTGFDCWAVLRKTD